MALGGSTAGKATGGGTAGAGPAGIRAPFLRDSLDAGLYRLRSGFAAPGFLCCTAYPLSKVHVVLGPRAFGSEFENGFPVARRLAQAGVLADPCLEASRTDMIHGTFF